MGDGVSPLKPLKLRVIGVSPLKNNTKYMKMFLNKRLVEHKYHTRELII